MSGFYQFPQDFLWGAGTASYQIEGAAYEDGKGLSVWDVFCRKPGAVWHDHNGDVATDHYHRYAEDVALMKELNLKAYRFSVSWPRIFPDGRGRINQKGLDFYDRLVDALLSAGIQPWMTLYHWDMPQSLEDEFNGWQSRETCKAFAEYAAEISRHFSDRVTHYMTINEMWVVTDCCYRWGFNPPNRKLPAQQANQVRHNVILAHGMAVQALRANAVQPVKVGWAHNGTAFIPAMENEENILAAKHAVWCDEGGFAVPILEGKYSDHYLNALGADAPVFSDEDMKIISSPLDFVGLNVYRGKYVVADSGAPNGFRILNQPRSYPRLYADWLTVDPQSIYWRPRLFMELWKDQIPEIYITENGACCDDRMEKDGRIYDLDRMTYMRQYLISCWRAVQEGVPLKGYFHWSLLDNFEWKEGYEWRFGLIYVNYSNLKRIPKMSAEFYREIIRNNALL